MTGEICLNKKLLILFTLTVSLITLLSSISADARELYDGRYLIRPIDSRLVVTASWLPNKTYGKNSKVMIFHNENNRNWRHWRIIGIGGDQFKILWRDTNLALDIAEGRAQNGTPVIIWPYHGGSNQRWRIYEMENGGYSFINVGTGLALDLPGDNRTPRTRYHGYEENGTRAQIFQIIRLR